MQDTALIARVGRLASQRTKPYVLLLKPRVMSLVVFTAAVGLVIAPQRPPLALAMLAVALIALGAGAAGALNMWWDADIDIRMRRTRARPVPMGQVSGRAAMFLGLSLSILSVIALTVATNVLAGALLAFTIFFYAVIYTIWLKRRTPQNIVIGGAAGALPPMIGWAAATGDVTLASLSLFALILFWTPPHFWSLALFMRDDYDRAGVPMLTVTHGRAATRRHILGYTFALALIAPLPLFTGIGGPIYALATLSLNLAFLRGAVRIARRDEHAAETDRYSVERGYFRLSLWYLFIHFAALMADAGFGLSGEFPQIPGA
ncbi:heme o synthase [Thiosulfatihalobacter marinus]|uniref:heme o synthase n=1 Tax=Thiosulfatihalobacter marinus TaxID=2792481 RepID=UPI0018D6E47A|nr:heme o synthase [Thiosulfatihalobacter marinus]